jgi:DNA-binding NarL/FixJ family response regulator
MSQCLGRILIVDDFEPWRGAVRSMLDGKFQIVGEAGGGFDAVTKAQELEANLILLDIGLPDMDGIEAGRKILENSPGAKVIFVTANSDCELMRTALGIGAMGYVLKADAGRELLKAIDAVLHGERFVSRRVIGNDPARSDSG